MQLPRSIQQRSTRRAFTLMEVLVVVAIIVVLAGIATVSLKYLSDSKYDTAKVMMKKIESAAFQFSTRHGDYPNSVRDLLDTSDGSAYLEETDVKDPWGQDFIIDKNQRSPTGKPKISCQGEPGKNRAFSNW